MATLNEKLAGYTVNCIVIGNAAYGVNSIEGPDSNGRYVVNYGINSHRLFDGAQLVQNWDEESLYGEVADTEASVIGVEFRLRQ